MEWKPNFGKGSPKNPTSLIQLSTGNILNIVCSPFGINISSLFTDKVCVIFWMMHLGNQLPLELFRVLSSPHILKIGQSLGEPSLSIPLSLEYRGGVSSKSRSLCKDVSWRLRGSL
jgi:hypothetical protein